MIFNEESKQMTCHTFTADTGLNTQLWLEKLFLLIRIPVNVPLQRSAPWPFVQLAVKTTTNAT